MKIPVVISTFPSFEHLQNLIHYCGQEVTEDQYRYKQIKMFENFEWGPEISQEESWKF